MSPKKKTLLCINTGYRSHKRFIFQRLNKLPINLVVVNAEKNWAEPYVDDWIIAKTTNHSATIQAIKTYLETHEIDGVITFWEDDVLLTAKIVDTFGLLGITYDSALKVRNKFEFRKFCADNGIKTPQYKIVATKKELQTIAATFNFPVVVKPVFGSSSAYVIKAETKQELDDIFTFVKENVSHKVESSLGDGLEILVEEYIDGDEVDIDMLVQNGKVKFRSISDNFATQEPFFLENGQATPSSLPQKAQHELIQLAEYTLERLGIMHGCIHFEAKYTTSGPIPIEVNVRLGGDESYPFNKTVWKVDLIEHAVNIALGEYIPKVDQSFEPKKYVMSKTFIAEKSGIITRLNLPKKFPDELHVLENHFYKEIGDSALAAPSDYEFLGWIACWGENSNDARENLDEAVKLIDYEVVPFSSLSTLGKTEKKSQFRTVAMQPRIIQGKARIERIRHLRKKDQRNLTIGIACNNFLSDQGVVESDLTLIGKRIEETLQKRGYKTIFIDFNNLDQAIDILKTGKADFVFNVGERLNNSSLLEPHIASLFDAYQIPYTGSNPFTLGLCIDKIKVKKLLNYHKIPTARWDYAYDVSDEISDELRYPLIVKPANTDNSIGITNDSVVTNKHMLQKQIEYIIQTMRRPVLVEEYLESDEYDVSIIGSEDDDIKVLPLSRTIYDKLPEGLWHISPFESKYLEGKVYKEKLMVERPPKNVNKKLLTLITEIALDTYNILDCHDYGRVEIKLDKSGNPHVLELNPNPSIDEEGCMSQVAKLAGFDYGDFLEEIIALAIKRYKDRPPFYHLQPTII